MRNRYFFYTITGEETTFDVRGTDNLKAIKIKDKPYVYNKSTELKVGDKVMIIRPGTVIRTPKLIEHKFNFLPKVFVYSDDPNDRMEGRLVKKRDFGKYTVKNYDVDGTLLDEKERTHVQSQGVMLTEAEFAFFPSEPEHINLYLTKYINGHAKRIANMKIERLLDEAKQLARYLERDVQIAIG